MPVCIDGLKDGSLVHVEVEDTSSATGRHKQDRHCKKCGILLSAADFGRLRTADRYGVLCRYNTPLRTPLRKAALNFFYRLNSKEPC